MSFFDPRPLRSAIVAAGANGDQAKLRKLRDEARGIEETVHALTLAADAEMAMRPALMALVDFWCSSEFQNQQQHQQSSSSSASSSGFALTATQSRAVQWFVRNNTRLLEAQNDKFEIKQDVFDHFCFVEAELCSGAVKMRFRSTFSEVMSYSGDGMRDSVIEVIHAQTPAPQRRYGELTGPRSSKYERYMGVYGGLPIFRVGQQQTFGVKVEDTNFPDEALRCIVRQIEEFWKKETNRTHNNVVEQDEEEIRQNKAELLSMPLRCWAVLLAVIVCAESLRDDMELTARWAAGNIHELVLAKDEAQTKGRRKR